MEKKVSLIPNYKLIYMDYLTQKHPSFISVVMDILTKESLSIYDVMTIEKRLEPLIGKDNYREFRAYDRKTIFKILDYQKKHKLNNSELGKHFNLSRVTIAKWKKMFLA